jgi:type II secretory pathway pseudopilin PulG
MTRTLIYRPAPSKGSGFRVQGSGNANCKLQIANCKLPAKAGIGRWAVGDIQCGTANGFFHLSSFISNPSTLGSNRYKPGNKLPCPHAGYTLVEILVATVLTLVLMGAVVQMFGALGQSITDSRSFLEASERLNSAAARLQMDLKGITVKMIPPRNPDDGEGYFEYIEGPAPPQQYVQKRNTFYSPYDWDNNPLGIEPRPVNTDNGQTDTTVGDFDDILMFTTRSTGRPFVGMFNFGTALNPKVKSIQSDVAEVIWFIRGRTLYRRQLLVAPGVWNNLITPPSASRFYESNDISVRWDPVAGVIVPNTLSDLTRRECRYAHPTDVFPFDARRWGLLGMPTLRESATWDISNPPWPPSIPNLPPLNPVYPSKYFYLSSFSPTFNLPFDFWTNDASHRLPDPCPTLVKGPPSIRIADDIILTNVIGFDVKAWEPALGQYVDLGYEMRPFDPSNPSKVQEIKHYPAAIPTDAPEDPSGKMFYHRGYSSLNAPDSGNGYYAYLLGCYFKNNPSTTIFAPRVYDTWSTHYESVGLAGLDPTAYPPGRSTNGLDDDGNGMVDDEGEKITSPPYPAPLRAIQVKIRVFEPDSRQIRELTIVQDFLPK